jgi:multidrug resistance efflux pump
VEAGKRVEAGQLLVELDTRDMLLSAMEADNQLSQFEKQADEALRKGELSEAAQARARGEQARARRDLLRSQIERSRITSPIAGTITAGDLKDRIGAAVKLGDRLFEVADLRDLQVIARVDDRDIGFIGAETTGEISPKSAPSLKVPFVVEQVVPLARSAEGENVFEVRGRMTGALPGTVLDGMEGQARFNTEERSLAWIASRRILDQLRVWLWW